MIFFATVAFFAGIGIADKKWKRRAIQAGVAEYVIDPPDSNIGKFKWKKMENVK
jgi:hypothetical protein